VPPRLDLYGLSTEALDAVLDHGSKVSSIFAHHTSHSISYESSTVTPMEDLVLFVDEDDNCYQEESV